MKDLQNIIMVLMSEKDAAGMLEQIPHKKLADLAVIYITGRQTGDGDSESTVVSNNDIQAEGIKEEDLMMRAVCGCPAVLSPVPGGIRQIEELYGKKIRKADIDADLFTVSTARTVFGAAVIAYPGFLDSVSKKLGADIILFPFSVNEFLLMKCNGNVDYREFMNAIEKIKEGMVTPDLDLTSNVYRYGKRGLEIIPDRGRDSLGKKFAFAGSTIQSTFS